MPISFASVAAFLECLEGFDQDIIGAQASSHFGQAKSTDIVRKVANTDRSRNYGEVVAVARAGNDLEEKDCEMRQVFVVLESVGRLGRNAKFDDPPFNATCNSKQQKDAARRAFGDGCVN